MTQDNTIDFGLLNERFQKEILGETLTRPSAKRDLVALNPFMADPGKTAHRHARIAHNRKRVRTLYNRARYRKTLLDIYKKVVRTPVRHRIDKGRLLISFFDLNRFSLLKWCRDEP